MKFSAKPSLGSVVTKATRWAHRPARCPRSLCSAATEPAEPAEFRHCVAPSDLRVSVESQYGTRCYESWLEYVRMFHNEILIDSIDSIDRYR